MQATPVLAIYEVLLGRPRHVWLRVTPDDARPLRAQMQPAQGAHIERERQAYSGKLRRVREKADTHADGRRSHYFADDDEQSDLQTMVQREKLGKFARVCVLRTDQLYSLCVSSLAPKFYLYRTQPSFAHQRVNRTPCTLRLLE